MSVATEADRGQWKLVSKIHDGTTLLTLNQQRALDAGLAQAIVRDQTELQQFLGATSITTLRPSRVAVVAYWLTQPWVRALLMVAMLLGAYLELQAPGLGVPGFVATVSLVLLVVAPFLIGLAAVMACSAILYWTGAIISRIFCDPRFWPGGCQWDRLHVHWLGIDGGPNDRSGADPDARPGSCTAATRTRSCSH